MKVWIVLLFTFGLFFQEIGLIVVIVSFLLYKLLKSLKNKKSGRDLFKNKETKGNIFHQLDEYEINTKDDVFGLEKIDSYKDILYYGKEDEKIELIGMAVYNPNKEFISLIRIALNDETETVRILASNSLQKMENFFEDEILRLEKKLKKTDDISKKDKIHKKLIKTYDKYIDSTLIDKFLEDQYINKIFSCFKQIKELNTKDKLFYLYLHLSIKYNRLDDIYEDLKVLLKKDDSLINKFLLLEYFYKKSDYKNLYELLTKIDEKDIKNTKYEDSYRFWMQNVS